MSRFPTFAAAALFVPLSACAEAEPALTPASGDWDFSLGEWTGGDCAFDRIYLNATEATFPVEGRAGAFSVDFGDNGVLDCTVDGLDFDCPAIPFYTTDLASGDLDAVVTTDFGGTGTFADDAGAAFTGTFRNGFSCAGGDCGDLGGTQYGADARFPCGLTGAWSAALAAE